MTFDPENSTPPGAKIKVIGVGGGGGNAVNTMIRSGLDGVDFITCNTDVQALRYSLARQKLQIGRELTRGLGAGADPDIGRDAALEDKTEIQNLLRDADMVFITAGMGGGTGTGGAAVVAQLARELGALTVAVVTKPFTFEGKRRRKQAEAGIARLRESVDTLITIPNQRLLQVASPELSMIDAFKMADEVLVNAVRGISDIINIHGMINVDFADVKTVMSCMGQALMGIGSGRGERRAVDAALMAISSPLLEEVDIEGATGILINITGGSRVTMHEINEACGVIQEAAHEDANIIIGAVIDENLGEEIRVTVIATGFPVEKTEDDSDPFRGKPFPSNTANRLAAVARQQPSVQSEPIKEPSKPQESSNTPLGIEDLPQSPYDDLAFSGKPTIENPQRASQSIRQPEAFKAEENVVIDPIPRTQESAPAQSKVEEIKPSSHDSLAAKETEATVGSTPLFAFSRAEEAQELARWTLDYSGSKELNLLDEIPSLAIQVHEDQDAADLPVVSTEENHILCPVSAQESDPKLIFESGLEAADADHNSTHDIHAKDLKSASPVISSPDSVFSSELDVQINDPKEEFAAKLDQTLGHSSLDSTLFDENLTQILSHMDSQVQSHHAEKEVTFGSSNKSDEQSGTTLQAPRKGATKEEPSLAPLVHEGDEFDLTEIDKKIDEALDLADRMRASSFGNDKDDLDIPAFLRTSMKDIPLD